MANIILNSIPGMGKKRLIKSVIEAYAEQFNGKADHISLGRLFQEFPMRMTGTKRRHAPNIDYVAKQYAREGTIEKAKNMMREFHSDSLIFDTPLTIYPSENSIGNIVRYTTEFIDINEIRTIDSFVTLIDEANAISERLKGTPYPHENDTILDWEGWDMEIAKEHANTLDRINGRIKDGEDYMISHLVLPKQNSEINLLKLLHGYEKSEKRPVVIYFGFTISELKIKDGDSDEIIKQKKEAEKNINDIVRSLQDYALIVTPVPLEEVTPNKKARAFVRALDLYYFIPYCDLFVGYIPEGFSTEGVPTEFRYADQMGKPTILIHPENKPTKAFGINPSVHFHSKDELLENLANLESADFENPMIKEDLRMLLDDNGNPRHNEFKEIIDKYKFFTPLKINY